MPSSRSTSSEHARSGSTFQDFKGPKVYNVQNSCGEVPSFFQSPLLLCCSCFVLHDAPIKFLQTSLTSISLPFVPPLLHLWFSSDHIPQISYSSLQVQVTKIYTNTWEVQISFQKSAKVENLGIIFWHHPHHLPQHHPPEAEATGHRTVVSCARRSSDLPGGSAAARGGCRFWPRRRGRHGLQLCFQLKAETHWRTKSPKKSGRNWKKTWKNHENDDHQGKKPREEAHFGPKRDSISLTGPCFFLCFWLMPCLVHSMYHWDVEKMYQAWRKKSLTRPRNLKVWDLNILLLQLHLPASKASDAARTTKPKTLQSSTSQQIEILRTSLLYTYIYLRNGVD